MAEPRLLLFDLVSDVCVVSTWRCREVRSLSGRRREDVCSDPKTRLAVHAASHGPCVRTWSDTVVAGACAWREER